MNLNAFCTALSPLEDSYRNIFTIFIKVQKYTPIYIILLFLLVGFTPAGPAMAKDSAVLELQAAHYMDNDDAPVKSDFYRPEQLHITHAQNGGWQNGHDGGTALLQLSVLAQLRFVSSQRHALAFAHIQDHLLHNYPSHHFW